MTHELESERNLIERARQGDDASWRAIYEATCDRLLAFLCFQIGDRDEAKDILQDTYLRAFQKLKTYRGEAPVRGLATRHRPRTIARLEARDPAPAETFGDVDGVEWTRGIGHRVRAVRLRARRPLPRAESALVRQRAALLMREWEGRSFREIAAVLGCRESTARVHHTRAREHMRAALCGESRPTARRNWEGQQT
jgi:RNA polymerase sigma-70 factor (ECF subfamily)